MFQFHWVRLIHPSGSVAEVYKRFQFHWVRLIHPTNNKATNIAQFQFHWVRLIQADAFSVSRTT